MKLEPWFRRWPQRLDWEKDELERAGMRYEVLGPGEDDVVAIDVVHTVDGTDYALHARFPDLYPYFRPEVTTRENLFRYHQGPFGHELCLLARDPALWTVDQSLARLIETQLPKIVRANERDDETAASLEETVPEPVSEAYAYAHRDVVLIDSAWRVASSVISGALELGLMHAALPLRAAVVKMRSERGEVLAEADPQLAAAFRARTVSGRWVRLPHPVMAEDAPSYVAELSRLMPEAMRPDWQRVGDVDIDVLGVVAEDEVGYTEFGDDWVFVVRVRTAAGRATGRATSPRTATPHLVRAMRAGRGDLTQRAPRLRTLQPKRVAVIGLGALGAPVVIALARAGVGELALVDADVVAAGTVSRWPLGLLAAGLHKVEALQHFLAANYPYTRVVDALGWRLGTPSAGGASDRVVLERALQGTHLVVDATANIAANHALADVAWEQGLPYVQVTATAGAWGGLVLRLERGRTACWSHTLATLADHIAKLPRDPEGSVRTIACSEVTFTGAGFDLTPLADEAVRIVVATLSAGDADGYPSAPWDAETLALREVDGRLCPPRWTAVTLAPVAGCSSCR